MIFPQAQVDFVCSSLIMTQFGAVMHGTFLPALVARFGSLTQIKQQQDGVFMDYMYAATDFFRALAFDHLANLHFCLRQDGAAYFADTAYEQQAIIGPNKEVTWQPRSHPIFADQEVRPEIRKLFAIQHQRSWLWTSYLEDDGKKLNAFLVLGYALQKM